MEVEHGLVGVGDLGEVAASGVHDALGGCRRPRRVKDEEEVLGGHVLRLAYIGRGAAGSLVGAVHQFVPPVIAARDHYRYAAHRVVDGPLDNHDMVDTRALRHGDVDVAFQRDGLAAAPAPVSRHHHPGLGVEDPVAQRIGREPAEHHRVHRPDPGAGQHRHGQLGDHRHVDRHPIASDDSQAAQDVGEPGHLDEELCVADGPRVARLPFPVVGDLVASARGHMAVQAVVRDVERPAIEPAGERQVPFQYGVPGAEPVEGSGLLRPELRPEPGGFLVDAGIADHRTCLERRRRRKDPLLVEVVLDGRLLRRRRTPARLAARLCGHCSP